MLKFTKENNGVEELTGTECIYPGCDIVLFPKRRCGQQPVRCLKHQKQVRREKQLAWYHKFGADIRRENKTPLCELREKYIVEPKVAAVQLTAEFCIPEEFVEL